MTPAQRKWLEKLRDEGPSARPRYGAYPCAECKRKGWSEGQWYDDATGEPVGRNEAIRRCQEGVHVKENITDAGLEALSR